MVKYKLQIEDLAARHPGLSSGIAASYREAAQVCFGRHHSPPTDLTVDRGRTIQAFADWQPPDDRLKGAWANEIDATEAGAYCVALASVELTDNLVAVRRAETRSGVDYYLAQKGDSPADLESSHRLEVSGMDKGDAASVKGRLRQKVEQARNGRSCLPAIAAVVAFSSRLVSIQDASEK
jgi:hypothetical protein